MAAYILKLEAQIVKLRGEKKAAEAAAELAAMETPVATAADNGATDGGGGDESKAAPAELDVASPRPGDDGEVSALKKQAAHLSEMLRDSLGEIEQLKARLAAKTGNASVDGDGDGDVDGDEQDSDANGDADADDGGASAAGEAAAEAAGDDAAPAGDAEASASDGGDATNGASSPGTPTVNKRRAKKGRRLSVSQAVQFYEKKAHRISEGDAEDTVGAALAANELQELSTRLEEVESDRDRLRQCVACCRVVLVPCVCIPVPVHAPLRFVCRRVAVRYMLTLRLATQAHCGPGDADRLHENEHGRHTVHA